MEPLLEHSNLPKFGYRRAIRSFGRKSNTLDLWFGIPKRRWITKLIQTSLSIFLLITIVINLLFIAQKTKNNGNSAASYESNLSGLNRRNSFRLQESLSKAITIEVLSSQARVTITVDGAIVVDAYDDRGGRGMHVMVLHQGTGAIMSQRMFDTYSPHEDEALALFLNMVSSGRIIIIAIKDEGTFQLRDATRSILKLLGSSKATELGWRDMWAFVVQKGGHVFGEQISKSPSFNTWGPPIFLRVEVPLLPTQESECHWPDSDENKRRKQFCNHKEGYGSVCLCSNPAPLYFTNEPLLNNQISEIPVAIIASNRPHYLYRSLRSLLRSPGVNPEMITVFIDGYYEEPLAVAKLFGLRGIQHTPLGIKNARISQHYRSSLTATFNIFPSAKYAIMLEEDLDVSPDFFSYFSQTLHLLEDDASIYCISAWNDQGYEHTSSNPSLLYRVETMPGLGWMVKRELYKEELEPKWPTPEKLWDWDMWMRLGNVRRDRECIIPDVSRTYHFGSSGLNMNSYFQDVYFKKRSFNALPYVEFKDVDRMKKIEYETLLEDQFRSISVLNHSTTPCDDGFLPEEGTVSYLLFIKMSHRKDLSTWLQVAKCLKIWDLDERGLHNGMWRLHLNSNPVFIIGSPYSPYSKWKPDDVSPIFLPPKNKSKKRKRNQKTSR